MHYATLHHTQTMKGNIWGFIATKCIIFLILWKKISVTIIDTYLPPPVTHSHTCASMCHTPLPLSSPPPPSLSLSFTLLLSVTLYKIKLIFVQTKLFLRFSVCFCRTCCWWEKFSNFLLSDFMTMRIDMKGSLLFPLQDTLVLTHI
jgi:hypothetical protein